MFQYLKYVGISVLLVVGVKPGHAQTWEITGNVIDAFTREPIALAYISTTGDAAYAFSDENGNFKLQISSAAKTIVAAADGYITTSISASHINNLTVHFELKTNAAQLSSEAIKEGERSVELYVKKMIDNREVLA